MASDELDEYRRKRHAGRTPEPAGRAARRGADGHRFVIQQHDASTMHWDLRLESGGVLRSWSVPKGPSTDPREKRLAIPTEDHPLEYAEFEGIIPEDQYGGGRVIVWDTGTYRVLSAADGGEALTLDDALGRGHASVWLEGEKLRGGYALVRLGRGRDEWLLVKMDDEGADARRRPTSTEPASVLSGRSVDEVGEDVER